MDIFCDFLVYFSTTFDDFIRSIGITIKKDYGIIETEKPANYGNQAMVKKMVKLWITVVKGAAMDKKGMAKVLDMMGSVMVMVESKLLLPKGIN